MISHSGASSSNGNNQYIRPDYLSPMPSALDAQKSPLAMLAATCNSIGAPDLPKNIKSVELPPQSKKSASNSSGGNENKRPRKSSDTPEKRAEKTREKSEEKKPIEVKSENKSPEPEDRKPSKSPPAKHSPTPPKSLFTPSGSVSMPFTTVTPSLSDSFNFAARMKQPGMQMPGIFPYGGCRDPFCTGCSPSMYCGTNPSVPMDYSALSSYASLSNGLSYNKNLTCNWVGPGESYCGKRFPTSEELWSHLRTHTNLSVPSLNDPLQNAAYAASYASYLSRFPSLGLNPSRFSGYKPQVPGVTSPMTGFSSLWPGGPTPGFFAPSPYSYYRPPF